MGRKVRPRTIAVLSASAALIGVVVWGGGLIRPPVSDATPSDAETKIEAPSLDMSPVDDVSAIIAKAPVLPPVDAPFGQTFASLDAMARAGNGPAACRLAVEFERCENFARLRLEHERWLADRQFAIDGGLLTRRPDPENEFGIEFERELRSREGTLDRERTHCANAPSADPARRLDLWRSAALRGHPAAMRIYASGAAFELDHILELNSQIAVYKGEATTIARAAAAAGDIPMLVSLSAAYSPVPAQSRPFLVQAVTRKDGAYALALLRHAVRAAATSPPPPGAAMYVSDVVRRIAELESMLPASDQDRAMEILEHDFSKWATPRYDSIAPNSRALGGVEAPEADDCATIDG